MISTVLWVLSSIITCVHKAFDMCVHVIQGKCTKPSDEL